ncbi:AbrB/MazE/SpoVT family DNA-binding domain-containing protein [Sulfurisphaera ohwakuensis]|uniref:AbrB family looped-hinge helix DNA binding protein n=1 Tax=Sulfurisphaera ohwakuensis TaxID=69656 RepID=A0A650CKD7_SULOH|nr:AbrB/MazE/SpoVT family DNA-binding domain-containing protein [Sulfurisphaera ohwakuensis]MBB5254600.1 AbrB family looped-hinge helix DNA binding protein [Sulfurisphaera ohwakuensis]QGR18269.1 AbrB/MazE/SpoVT family DNA-binding domain-containing protein [Sulfurisphaera ohwakuensis]
METITKLNKKGIIVIPKGIRDEIGLKEGDAVKITVEGNKIVIEKIDLWDRVWNCCKGSAEEAEKGLDEEEEEFWKRK